MSDNELDRLELQEKSFAELVREGYKKFWDDRGVTGGLMITSGVPTWYMKAYGWEDHVGVFPEWLEPEELVERAITRKKILKR